VEITGSKPSRALSPTTPCSTRPCAWGANGADRNVLNRGATRPPAGTGLILLDTDVITLVQRADSPEGLRVRARILQLPETERYAVAIITYEEQMRGWVARMARAKTIDDQIAVYYRLLQHVANYRRITVVPFDHPAASHFQRLRALKIRIGTPNLRIAAITLSLNATLVSRNLHDFQRVPGLRVEDWTKD
jgi:tRNA(fMet)-specific endonuclease VapC